MQIYHNPRCSKSRQTLALIEEQGIQADIVLYLENPPTPAELLAVLTKLSFSPRQLIRKGEDAYKDLNLANEALSDTQLIKAMCENPKLIERPVVIDGEHAVVGRPPENVKRFF